MQGGVAPCLSSALQPKGKRHPFSWFKKPSVRASGVPTSSPRGHPWAGASRHSADSRRGGLSDPEPATRIPDFLCPLERRIPTLLKSLSFASWLQLLTNLTGPGAALRSACPAAPIHSPWRCGDWAKPSPALAAGPCQAVPTQGTRTDLGLDAIYTSRARKPCHVVPHQPPNPLLRAPSPAPKLSGPSTDRPRRSELQLRSPGSRVLRGSSCTLRLPPPRSRT